MYDPKKVEDFFKARKFKQGLAYVENFLRKDPNNPEYLNDYGLFFSYVYGFEWGQKYLHRALEQQKDYYPAILNLVEFYLKNNLPFSAIKVLENACIEQYQDLQEKLTRLKSTYQPDLVSFYIPIYNVEKYIEMCIQNVLKQTYPICELLIIDDASPDNSMSIVHKYQENYPNLIKIITHPTNKGLAAVRNTALAHARGEFLATVDTDAIPEETFLEKIMMEFHRHSDKLAGICGKLLELNSITVTDRWREVHMKQHWGDKICEPAFLYGSTSVFRKEALKKVGGFREALRNNGEDMDISAKLKQHNYQLLYLPQAKAYHLRKDSLKSVVNTFYNWVMPSYVDGLDNFTQLLQKTVNCLNLLLTRLQEDIKFKRYHLFYPTFLSILAWPLKDIKHSALDEEVKTQTVHGLASFLLYLVRQNPAISKELVDFLSADLAEMLSLSNLNQLKDISKSATTPTRQIKELFPKAHLEFILKVSEQLKNVFNFEPLIYKMLEVCRRRIAYEESWQPKYDFPKVLLANPPWRDGKRYGIRAGSRWPFTVEVPQENWTIPPQYVPFPFFLAYTTSLLKEKGFNAVMLDAIAEGLLDEEFFTRIQGYAPDLLLIETATASIYNDIDYVRKLKTLLPKTKIILTGTHVTHFKQKFLEEYPCVDGIIIGEYEEAMLNIVNYFKEKGSFNGIEQKGFLFFDPKGEIQGSAVKTDLVDIDALPYPERLTLPIYNYEDLFAGMVFPSLQIHASRGCPYGCIYCVWPQVLYNSSRYRTRDPIKVVDEIEKMIQDYGYRSFYFDDDTFNIGKQRILTLCAEIKKRGLNKIPWSVMARADTSDFETLKAMQDAGLNSIKFGVESGVQELVDACGKGLDLKKVEQAVQWCKQLGLQFHLTFTFGLPGETKETIEKTIQYAMKLAPDTCQFSLTTPFPGTKHFELAKNKGLLLTQNWDRYDGNRYTVMRGENLSQEELEQAVKEAYRRWEEFDRKRKCTDCAQGFSSDVIDYNLICSLIKNVQNGFWQGDINFSLDFIDYIKNNKNIKLNLKLFKYEQDKKEILKFVKNNIYLALGKNVVHKSLLFDEEDLYFQKKYIEFTQKNIKNNDVIINNKKYQLSNNIFGMSVFFHKLGLNEIEKSLLDKYVNKTAIDCGAYIGDSSLVLYNYFPQVYALEPEENNFKLLKKTIQLNKLEKHIIPLKIGVGNKKTVKSIKPIGDSSFISEKYTEGNEIIFITTIDDLVKENNLNVGLIKMDIEGYELKAIKGAEATIKKQKPILIISVYHRSRDFFEIPNLIAHWIPEYQFRFLNLYHLHPIYEKILICYV